MCIDVAEVLDRQAGREYVLGSYKEKPACGNQLHLLCKDDLADLPTNNLHAEPHLCLVGKL